jgi:hypothetical protein
MDIKKFHKQEVMAFMLISGDNIRKASQSGSSNTVFVRKSKIIIILASESVKISFL